MATALTYQTCEKRGALRTVIVDDVRQSIVLLPTGSLDVVTAKLLHGTTCRHPQWAEWLGTDPNDETFIIPSAQIVQIREIQIATNARHK
jgi:hypothetical protein